MIGHVTSHHAFKMAAPLDVRTKQEPVIEFITAEVVPQVDIHMCFKNVYGDYH